MIEIPFTKVQKYVDSQKQTFEQFDEIARNIDLSKNKILLFNLPHDSNLGDHAQTVCILDFLKIKFSSFYIYTFPVFTDIPFDDIKKNLKRLSLFVSESDIIVFHSGYHINDIYCNMYDSIAPTAMLQLAALSVFKNNRIIYFPQTINLSAENFIRYANALNIRKNVTMFCRDKKSFELAKKHFPTDVRLMPDIVTSMIGRYVPIKKKNEKRCALIALRNRVQKESFVSDEEIELIKSVLLEKGFSIYYGGTYIDEAYDFIVRDTDKIVKNKIDEFASYNLVITDLYHGMIFSVIANTPVVVLPSSDHKIASGVLFFRETKEFDKRVYFFEKIDMYVSFFEKLTDKDLLLQAPEPYFWEKYYKDLVI